MQYSSSFFRLQVLICPGKLPLPIRNKLNSSRSLHSSYTPYHYCLILSTHAVSVAFVLIYLFCVIYWPSLECVMPSLDILISLHIAYSHYDYNELIGTIYWGGTVKSLVRKSSLLSDVLYWSQTHNFFIAFWKILRTPFWPWDLL